ncbi:MAG TPA: hypothetical protein VD932_05365 [Aquabacterium sp.]|nr:hypothetical protein [Aquabacterium sp.]
MSHERGASQLEEGLRAAVRSFAASMSSTSPVVADMSTLVRATSTLPLFNLAYWERLIRDEFELARPVCPIAESSGWRALLASTVSKGKERAERHLTWIDLNSRDGRERERVLRTLAGPAPNSFFFALAARRLNDWVPQVRAAAREAIPRLALSSDPEHVVETLCAMLPSWIAWGRAEESDRQVIATLTTSPGVAASLKRRLFESTAGPMPVVLSQALQTKVFDEDLADIAAKAIQPAVRARAYRTLLMGKAVWVAARRWQWTDVRYCQGRVTNVLGERPLTVSPMLLDTLIAAAADQSSLVRRVAAEALVREMGHLGDAVLPLARQFAHDPSPPVAERGAFILQRLAAGN